MYALFKGNPRSQAKQKQTALAEGRAKVFVGDRPFLFLHIWGSKLGREDAAE